MRPTWKSLSSQRVRLVRTLWGVPLGDTSSWRTFFGRRPGAGPFFPFAKDPALLLGLLQEFQLELVMQVHTLDYLVVSASAREHIASLERKVHEAAAFHPVVINCHAGKDSFELPDIVAVVAATQRLERELHGATPILHETHRQRMLYSPLVLRRLLREAPDAAWR
jgi:hypothetical protein